MVFIDTNILVYAVSSSDSNPDKVHIARELLMTEDWCWSTQVALEFYSVTTRLSKGPILTEADAQNYIQVWMVYPMAGMTPQRFLRTLEVKKQYGLSIWDAAIVASAQDRHCETLITEDINHLQKFGSLDVKNPFV